MAEQTKIEWCDHTFNPWEGCQKVAPECDNCYAEARDQRFTGGAHWGPKAPRRRTSVQNWNKPRRWNAQADAFMAAHGRRQRVFCASLADVFDNAVDRQWRADLFDLIRACPNLDWLLLTKRPQNMARMLPDDWGDGWPNVWLGTNAGTQKTADQNIPHLLATPAAVRFVSVEPLLGPVNLTGIAASNGTIRPYLANIDALGGACQSMEHHSQDWFRLPAKLDWIIVGGESGPNARPMHPEWARSLRDQCAAAGTAFFFKQWGEWADHTQKHGDNQACSAKSDVVITAQGHIIGGGAKGYGGMVVEEWRENGGAWMCKTGKARAGRLLDGVEHNGMPGE